jgi:hypothetical protein
MANSCFGAVALLMLMVVAVIFVLTPHERSGVSLNPPTLWSSER